MTIVNKINIDTVGMFFEQDQYPVVHSSMVPNSLLDFYGTDNKEDFAINCKRLPESWVYKNIPISYKFNSNGLRMNKDLDDVADDYIVGFGCSHTVGVGVNLTDTWIHTLADDLKMDYINNGVSGGSIKLCAINFFNMLSSKKTLPKIAVFAWPSSVRYCFYEDGEFVFYLPRFITDDKKFQYHTKTYNNMLLTNVLTTEALFYRNMIKTVCDRLDIKYAEFTFDNTDELKNYGIPVIYVEPSEKDVNEDHARDVRDKSNGSLFSHPGKRLHRLAKEEILKQLRQNYGR